LRWLRAKAQEALGDFEEAEATLHAAEALDPAWPPTLLSLARYASDRGDVTLEWFRFADTAERSALDLSD
jgi:hypothetical protein